MLKFFYKILLVSLLSGSLLMLDFSYKGALIQMNSLRAETVKTEGVGGSNMMATLTMAAIGLLTSRLFSAKKTTDIWLAGAGGLAFVAGDILATFKNKAVMKDLETEITRDEKGQIDQKQIESLEKLKKSYEAAKETGETKKTLQMAAAAAFAAAGISAYTMAATEQSMAAACMLGIEGGLAASATVLAVCQGHTSKATAHQAKATAAYARPYCAGCAEGAAQTALATQETAEAAACNKELAACTAKIGFDMTLLQSYESTREVPGPSVAGLTSDTSQASTIMSTVPASVATCSNYAKPMAAIELAGQCPAMASLGNVQNSGAAPIVLAQKSFDLNRILYPRPELLLEGPKEYFSSHYFKKILSVLIPEARADLFSPMGIASGLAIKFILATSTTLASTIDINLLIPKRRAIVWGVLAGLSYAASSATGAEIEKIQGNIDKIDSILNSMYALKNGVAAANTTITNPKIDKTIAQNQLLAINPNKNSEIDLKAQGAGSLPCVTGSNPDKCPSFSSQINAQSDLKEMPDFVQQQISSISKLTDGLNGQSKISQSTLNQAQSLANQQNALRNELSKKQKALQEKLNARGSKTNLAKESAKLEAVMKAAVQKELDKSKTTAAGMLASFKGGSAGSYNAIVSEVANKENGNSGAAKAKTPVIAPSIVAIPAAIPFSNSKSESDLDLEAAERRSADEAAAAATQTASMDDYEIKNDITQDKDSSIFDLISNRYQKSGYPRLFKRIK